MDELWQSKPPCPNRPSSQWCPVSNQADTNLGQFMHPCVAQEIRIVERTFQQESLSSNLLNLSSQSVHPKFGRPELSNSLLGFLSDNMQQLRSGAQQAPARSSFLVSNQQWCSVSSANAHNVGAWPMIAAGSFSSMGQSQVTAVEAAGTAADFSHVTTGRDLTQVTRSGIQESARLKSNGLEMYKQALSMNKHALDAQLQSQHLAPTWLTDNRRQPVQSMQDVQRLPSVQKNVLQVPDASYSLKDQQTSGTPRSRLRVYCTSLSGLLIGGELILTETGRLGVFCLCHNWHMSVAQFSEHAGLYTVNPGSVVQTEGGETLVQWRKSFLSQFGVKVPEDHVGWEWNDQVISSVPKSGVSQVWDTSIGVGNSCSTGNGIFRAGLISSNPGEKGFHDLRENALRISGKPFRGGSELDFSPIQSSFQNTYDNISRTPDATLNCSFRGNAIGASAVNECIDFIKNGNQQFLPAVNNSSSFGGKNLRKGFGVSGWNNGEDRVHVENDTQTSNFELRLGQPSQQSVSLVPTISMTLQSPLFIGASGPNKCFMYERAAQRVWDRNSQQNMQISPSGRLSAFDGVMGQSKEGVRNGNRPNDVGRNREAQTSHVSQSNAECNRVGASDHIQPGMFYNVDNSPIFSNIQRCTEDPVKGKNKIAADTAPPMVKSSAFSQLLEIRALDDRVVLSGLEYEAPLDQIRNSTLVDSGNDLEDIHSRRSTSNMKSRNGKADGIKSVVGSYFPPEFTLYDNPSVSLRGPVEGVSSTSKAVARNKRVNQSVTSGFETCDSSQTVCIKTGVHNATSEGFSSSSQNQLLEQTIVRICEMMDQGNADPGGLVVDRIRVQEAPRDVSIPTGISDASATLVGINKPPEDLDPCLLEGGNEKRNLTQQSHAAIDQPLFKEHPSFQADSIPRCQDVNSCNPASLAEDMEDQYQLQAERSLPNYKDGEERQDSFEAEDKGLDEDVQGEKCNHMEISKYNDMGRSATRLFSQESVGKELVRNHVIDASSGIGKCCSSDEVHVSDRTNVRTVSVCNDTKLRESQTSLDRPVRQERTELDTVSRTGKPEETNVKGVVGTAEFGVQELMRSDVLDEGSGIGKCCTSDEVDMDIRTGVRPVSLATDAQMWGSPTSIAQPSTSDVNVSDTLPNNFYLWKLQSGKMPGVRQGETALEAAQVTGKKEKRRKTMKWKCLEVASTSENSGQADFSRVEDKTAGVSFLTHDRCDKRKLIVSDIDVVPNDKCLKRKRSLIKYSPECNSVPQRLDADKDSFLKPRDTEHRLQVKGKKLGIKLPQGLNKRQVIKAGIPCSDGTARYAIKEGVNSAAKRTKEFDGLRLRLGSEKRSWVTTKLKEKADKCCSNSDVGTRTLRNSSGRPIMKGSKMVSLSAILKIPGRGSGSHFKDTTRTHCKAHFKGIEKGEGEYQPLERMDVPISKIRCKPDSDSKGRMVSFARSGKNVLKQIVSLPRSGREVRKRSLWELTGNPKSAHTAYEVQPADAIVFSSGAKVPLSDKHKPADAINSNSNVPLVPRGERSYRFKSQNKDAVAVSIPSPMVDFEGKEIIGSKSRSGVCDGVFETRYMTKRKTITGVAMETFETLKNKQKPHYSRASPKYATKKRNAEEAFTNQTVGSLDCCADQGRPLRMLVKKSKFQDGKAKMACVQNMHSDIKGVEHDLMKRSKHGNEEGRSKLSRHARMKRARSDLQHLGDTACCVCGSSSSQKVNALIQCKLCHIMVHQACYGVAKIPRHSWVCRPCKAHAASIVCVLCGYAEGAMTRAKKSRVIARGLLLAWQGEDAKQKSGGLSTSLKNSTQERPADCLHSGTSCLNLQSSLDAMQLSNVSAGRTVGNNGRHEWRAHANFLKDENAASHLRVNGTDANTLGTGEEMFSRRGGSSAHAKLHIKRGESSVHNSVTYAVNDPNVTQWVHVVCALWMPGTRCVNVGTMSAFDVSGVSSARRKMICSICNRSGGACIQCRVDKCSTPFHPWCAHMKGLLQNEAFGDEGDEVKFFGRCVLHGKVSDEQGEMVQLAEVLPRISQPKIDKSTSARTEGHKRREISCERGSLATGEVMEPGSMAVSQEQISAWLRINERKGSTRKIIKPSNSDLRTDHREYLRFKQDQRWKHLAVYKSGIHALGLYTAEFITKGEMVVEYIGELIGQHVADKRVLDYHSGSRKQYKGACYIFRIEKDNFIDATRKGGIARFVNHSCSPNSVAKVITVKNQKKVVLFAERDIYAGEEITYDYKFSYERESKIQCFCNAYNCRGYIN